MKLVALYLTARALCAQLAIHVDAGSTADQYFSGGFAYTYPGSPAQFPTMRYGTTFTYSIPTAPGQYTVKLGFVERIVSAAGAHQFSVSLQGTVVLDHYDIFADVGANTPVTKTFQAAVTAGPLQIVFATNTRNAIVNSIDVIPAPSVDLLPIPPTTVVTPVTRCFKRTVTLAEIQTSPTINIGSLPPGWILTSAYHQEVDKFTGPAGSTPKVSVGIPNGAGAVLVADLGTQQFAVGFGFGFVATGPNLMISAVYSTTGTWQQYTQGTSYFLICGHATQAPAAPLTGNAPLLGPIKGFGRCPRVEQITGSGILYDNLNHLRVPYSRWSIGSKQCINYLQAYGDGWQRLTTCETELPGDLLCPPMLANVPPLR